MTDLRIEERKDSPDILLSVCNNECFIKGRSFPEDSQAFYQPVIDWFDKIPSPHSLEIKIDLFYISSASTIALRRLFKKMEALKPQGFEFKIKWYFEKGDDDIKLSGERYRDSSSLEFELIEYE